MGGNLRDRPSNLHAVCRAVPPPDPGIRLLGKEQPMRMFRPLHTVRTPGWPSRVAAGLATAGLVTGVIHAQPASAHLSGQHRVHINGYMSLRDIDDLSRDEVCD